MAPDNKLWIKMYFLVLATVTIMNEFIRPTVLFEIMLTFFNVMTIICYICLYVYTFTLKEIRIANFILICVCVGQRLIINNKILESFECP